MLIAKDIEWFQKSLPPFAWIFVKIAPIFLLPRQLLLYRLHKKNAGTRMAGLHFKTRFSVPHPKGSPATMILLRWLQRQQLQQKSLLVAGNGCGVLTVFAARNGAKVLAVASDPEAVSLTCENVDLHGLSEQVTCRENKALSGIETPPLYDLIVFEPSLFVSADFASHGKPVALRWLAQAQPLLAQGGRAVLVLHDGLPLARIAKAFETSGYDLAGHECKLRAAGRWHLLLLKSAKPVSLKKSS
ncbi:MAG: methyltransferase [Deferribacteres bacterium]|nr:methyltransferase [candidate division KSB1 bacterium]MCB9510016.1 methyltransferase [Deferribacteres bacterium]